MNESPTDEQIVAQVLEGDADAFEILIGRHKHQVFGAIARQVRTEDVEDVAQEAFIRAYRSLGSFRGNSQFKTWLNTIAVRTCYDYWRKHYRSGAANTQTDPMESESVPDDTLGAPVEDQRTDLLAAALDQLSAEDRMVVQLMYLEEHSVAETAELLGWSRANVKVRAFRTRGKLKQLMEKMKDTL